MSVEQCYGWTCIFCGHHSISATSPVSHCAKCRKENPDRSKARMEQRNYRARLERMLQKRAQTLSEAETTLTEDVPT